MSRFRFFQGWAVPALVLLLACPAAPAPKKTKQTAPEPTATQRLAIDTRNLVWPQPPAIARIRYLDMSTGQKFDPTILEKQKHPKKNWKNALAGGQSESEKQMDLKIPFQFIRVYGVAADSKG